MLPNIFVEQAFSLKKREFRIIFSIVNMNIKFREGL